MPQGFRRIKSQRLAHQRFLHGRGHHFGRQEAQLCQGVAGQQLPHQRQNVAWPQPLVPARLIDKPQQQIGEQAAVRQLPCLRFLASADQGPEPLVGGQQGGGDQSHGLAVEINKSGRQQCCQLLRRQAVAQAGQLVKEDRLAYIAKDAGVVKVKNGNRPAYISRWNCREPGVDQVQIDRKPVFSCCHIANGLLMRVDPC